MLLLVGVGLFVTTLGNPLWLAPGVPVGGLPLNYLLKERLGMDATAIATFFSMVGLPWFLKPIAGILCDGFPIFGTRRRHYLLLASAIACVLWLVVGLVEPSRGLLLGLLFVLSTAVMLASTATGGLLVEAGQRHGATGRLSALRIGIMRVSDLAIGPLGGWLAGGTLLLLGVLGAGLQAFLFLAVFALLREAPGESTRAGWPTGGLRAQARIIGRSRPLLAAAVLVFLVMAEPGFGTPLFFHQTDELGFSTEFIGLTGAVGAAAGIVGAVLYGRFCLRQALPRILAAGIVCHAIGTLVYLKYDSQQVAVIVAVLSGLFLALSTLPLLDLAARATPRGSEALGYALMASVMNLAILVSNLAGSWLYSGIGLTFRSLVWVNSGTTLLVLFAIPFLPRALTEMREGETFLPQRS